MIIITTILLRYIYVLCHTHTRVRQIRRVCRDCVSPGFRARCGRQSSLFVRARASCGYRAKTWSELNVRLRARRTKKRNIIHGKSVTRGRDRGRKRGAVVSGGDERGRTSSSILNAAYVIRCYIVVITRAIPTK